ncbi:MAG: hypothetical protein M9890_07930 [Thermomicrobiales bacterium]|nr:hypothetical protein [Thermomicrobiales bacterium]
MSVTYTVTDSSAPIIGYTLDPATPDGANGWYSGTVTPATWTVTEPETPDTLSQVGCANQTITADQAETTYPARPPPAVLQHRSMSPSVATPPPR